MHDYLAMSLEEFQALPDYQAHYWELHRRWLEEKATLEKSKANELGYRMLLGRATFTDPQEGSTTHLFGNHKKAAKLVLKQPVNRRVDPNAIKQCIEDLRAVLGADADAVVRWKPELAITNYKKLTAEQQLLLAPAVTTSMGTFQLEYTKAKD